MKRELTVASQQLRDQRSAQAARRARLDREQAKLLQAYYQSVVTKDLFQTEQKRIEREIASVADAEAELSVGLHEREEVETKALGLARSLNLAEAYRQAPAQVQRYLNRACFARLDLDDVGGGGRRGHHRHYELVVTEAKLRRTLDYQQLVYALLLLADQAGIGEEPKV